MDLLVKYIIIRIKIRNFNFFIFRLLNFNCFDILSIDFKIIRIF